MPNFSIIIFLLFVVFIFFILKAQNSRNVINELNKIQNSGLRLIRNINDVKCVTFLSGAKNKNYSFQIVRLKGEVNDTILVKPCENCKVEKLSGQISVKFKNEFHTGISRFSFDPYKATSGKLKIVHKIR